MFTFDIFTPSFCTELVQLIDAFEATDLPRRRPNTMNNYGLVLTEIGLSSFAHSLVQSIVGPLTRRLFSDEIFATSLDAQHTFCVEYKAEELGDGDRNLDMHHDAAEVTLNVCLGRGVFEASGLQFCGRFGARNHRGDQLRLKHKVGQAVMHLGRHRHGADDIAKGERINLIVWARSTSFRAAAAYGHVPPDGYPKELGEGSVDRVCLSRANDADYEEKVRIFDGGVAEGEGKRKFTPFVAPAKTCAMKKKGGIAF